MQKNRGPILLPRKFVQAQAIPMQSQSLRHGLRCYAWENGKEGGWHLEGGVAPHYIISCMQTHFQDR